MLRLLSANMLRLRKAPEFRLLSIATLMISVAMIRSGAGTAASMQARGFDVGLDDFYFEMAPFLGAIMAVFVSLFLGTEYSDGTMRNKLVVGHTRANIYLAGFLTCFLADVVFTALWFVGGLPGLVLIGPFEMGLWGALTYFFVAVGVAAVFTALFVGLSTLYRNKAVAVVLALVLWLGLALLGSGVCDRLDEVEFHGGMAMIDGEFVMMEDTPNPMYLSGGKRTAAEYLCRVLPTGQAIEMTTAGITTPGLNIAVSAAVTAAVTAAGIRLFCRKDLK